MDMKELVSTRSEDELFGATKDLALIFGIQWTEEINTLLQACINDPGLSPPRIIR